jgi:GDPmannose 4,6-dehydratase
MLGNLEARRDWGYAPEYVEAIWEMLQRDTADDIVIGTGEAHSVREFLEEAFTYAGLDWRKYVKSSDRHLRPLEVDCLIADTRKAREKLGWRTRIGFAELVAIMVDADMEAAGLVAPGRGKAILEKKFNRWNHWQNSVVRVMAAREGQASQS